MVGTPSQEFSSLLDITWLSMQKLRVFEEMEKSEKSRGIPKRDF